MIYNYLIDIFNTNVNIMFKIGFKITAYYKNVMTLYFPSMTLPRKFHHVTNNIVDVIR